MLISETNCSKMSMQFSNTDWNVSTTLEHGTINQKFTSNYINANWYEHMRSYNWIQFLFSNEKLWKLSIKIGKSCLTGILLLVNDCNVKIISLKYWEMN